jgi:hypothetical protein
MKIKWLNLFALTAAAVTVALVAVHNLDFNQSHELMNVSYAPTGGLYHALNQQFAAAYLKQTGVRLTVRQSQGGSSRQAKAVIDGLAADVVTLALPSDVDTLRKRGLIHEGWQERLPNHSQPHTSTIVFVVRKGNPKGIKDWPDLIAPGVEVLRPGAMAPRCSTPSLRVMGARMPWPPANRKQNEPSYGLTPFRAWKFHANHFPSPTLQDMAFSVPPFKTITCRQFAGSKMRYQDQILAANSSLLRRLISERTKAESISQCPGS